MIYKNVLYVTADTNTHTHTHTHIHTYIHTHIQTHEVQSMSYYHQLFSKTITKITQTTRTNHVMEIFIIGKTGMYEGRLCTTEIGENNHNSTKTITQHNTIVIMAILTLLMQHNNNKG